MDNREIVGKGLEELQKGLLPFVSQKMSQHYGAQWRSHITISGDRRSLDVAAIFGIILGHWDKVFKSVFAGTGGRAYIGELRGVRNKWAHQESFSRDEALRALDTILLLLKLVLATSEEKAITALRSQLITQTGALHKPADYKIFHELAGELFSRHFQVEFQLEYPIGIGAPPKVHRFDLVSVDERYVGECKRYTWTKSGNVPSAKIAHLNEAAAILSRLPAGTIRFLAILRSLRPCRDESLAEYYRRRFLGDLSGIQVYEIDETKQELRLIS
jgi:hypothetical protein